MTPTPAVAETHLSTVGTHPRGECRMDFCGWVSLATIAEAEAMHEPASSQVVAIVHCGDMEDYARNFNEGHAAAVEQFGELLKEAREDLADGALASELLGYLDDAVKAMGGPPTALPAPVCLCGTPGLTYAGPERSCPEHGNANEDQEAARVSWSDPGCTCDHRFGTEPEHDAHCPAYDPEVAR